MEIGKNTIAAGVGLFFLGGFSVYLLMANVGANSNATTYNQSSPPELTQTSPTDAPGDSTDAEEEADASLTAKDGPDSTQAAELTHDVFLAQAEARREQQLIDKAEADRLEKLRLIKERSVECKFWRQQQKNSSASAKIEEKITQYCALQTSSSDSSLGDESQPESSYH